MTQAYIVDRVADKCFMIVEKATEQNIAFGENGMSVRSAAGRMNKGCAFDGWTPTFFLKPGLLEVKSNGTLTKAA